MSGYLVSRGLSSSNYQRPINNGRWLDADLDKFEMGGPDEKRDHGLKVTARYSIRHSSSSPSHRPVTPVHPSKQIVDPSKLIASHLTPRRESCGRITQTLACVDADPYRNNHHHSTDPN
jgi:hypothetical protein